MIKTGFGYCIYLLLHGQRCVKVHSKVLYWTARQTIFSPTWIWMSLVITLFLCFELKIITCLFLVQFKHVGTHPGNDISQTGFLFAVQIYKPGVLCITVVKQIMLARYVASARYGGPSGAWSEWLYKHVATTFSRILWQNCSVRHSSSVCLSEIYWNLTLNQRFMYNCSNYREQTFKFTKLIETSL